VPRHSADGTLCARTAKCAQYPPERTVTTSKRADVNISARFRSGPLEAAAICFDDVVFPWQASQDLQLNPGVPGHARVQGGVESGKHVGEASNATVLANDLVLMACAVLARMVSFGQTSASFPSLIRRDAATYLPVGTRRMHGRLTSLQA
jgi:hypothetical protein